MLQARGLTRRDQLSRLAWIWHGAIRLMENRPRAFPSPTGARRSCLAGVALPEPDTSWLDALDCELLRAIADVIVSRDNESLWGGSGRFAAFRSTDHDGGIMPGIERRRVVGRARFFAGRAASGRGSAGRCPEHQPSDTSIHPSVWRSDVCAGVVVQANACFLVARVRSRPNLCPCPQ